MLLRPLQRADPGLTCGDAILEVELPAKCQVPACMSISWYDHVTDLPNMEQHSSPLIKQHWHMRQDVGYEVLDALHDVWAHGIRDFGAASLKCGVRPRMHCLLL
jgi:hypothetical protein